MKHGSFARLFGGQRHQGRRPFRPAPVVNAQRGPGLRLESLEERLLLSSPGVIQFSAPAFTAAEKGVGTLLVTRAGGSDGAVSVAYQTGGGSALAGKDYTAAAGTVSWSNQDSSPKTITVPMLDDGTAESGLEVFNVTLGGANGGATLGTTQLVSVTIQEETDPPPSPTVVSQTNIGNSGSPENTPTIAADLLNVNNVVSVFSEHDLLAPQQPMSFLRGQVSTQGGQAGTWSSFTLPSALLDPSTVPPAPFLQQTNASVGFDRQHHFFVAWTDRTADGTAGAVRVARYTLNSSVPVFDFVNTLYAWAPNSDEALNPYLVVDTNAPTFTDPITTLPQNDPYSGNVYVAWNTHNIEPAPPPPLLPFNPNFIVLTASSDAGNTWSAFTQIQAPTDIFTFARDATPRLAVSQGTADGRVKPGQLTVVWTDWGSLSLPPGTVPPLRSIVESAVIPSGAVNGVFQAVPGPINDATAAGPITQTFNGQGGLPIPANGLGTTDSTLLVPPNLFATMTALTVTMNISYPGDGTSKGDGDLQISLIDPSGAATFLTKNNGGFALPGNFSVTTLADNPGAPTIATGAPPYNGTFQPFEPLLANQPKRVGSRIDGTWHLHIVDNGTGSGTLVSWTLKIAGTTLQQAQTTDFPIQVNITDPRFILASNLNVTLALHQPDLKSTKILLLPPAGSGLAPITLLNNGTNSDGSNNPGRGTGGANPGEVNGTALGTIFDDQAIRSILDTGAPPFVGRFQPEYNDPSNSGTMSEVQGRTAAQLNGVWTLRIIDFVNDGNGTPTPRLDFATLHFTSGFSRPQSVTQVATPEVVGNEAAGYPFRPAVEPVVGIGPDVNIATDNTLGSASPFAGRMYMVYVDRDLLTPWNPPDNTNIMLQTSDDGGQTWSNPVQVNDDTPTDGFSRGDRPQFQPQIAVDQFTGAVVISYTDARFDASKVRTANMLAVSFDGGQSFAQQVFVNPTDTVIDAITGQNVARLRPLPDNDGGTNPVGDGAFGFGDRQGLAVVDGHVYNAWVANQNNGIDSDPLLMLRPNVWVAASVINAGPRIIDSTMGPAHTVTVGAKTFNNKTLADGTPIADGIAVRFDRPVDPGTFGTDQVQVFFQAAGGGGLTPVAVASVAPLDLTPSGATLFFIAFQTPQTATGTYSYSVGPNVRDLLRSPVSNASGNLMDQNSNAIAGEVGTPGNGGDIYAAPTPLNNGPTFFAPFSQDTLPLIISGPHVVSTHVSGNPATADNLVLNNTVNSVDVMFDRDMQGATFTPAAIVRMIGPSGLPILGPFTITPNPNGNDPDPNNPRTFRIGFPTQQLPGTYTLTLAPVVRAKNGDLMDQNQNAGVDMRFDKPSGGTTPTTQSNFTPQAIAFGDNKSTSTVGDNFVLQGVDVALDITFPDDRDLTATLTAPDGTQVRLFTKIGSPNPPQGNFTNTILSDAASTPQGDPNPITGPNARPPYNGTFNPQQPLSVLKGKASGGTWTLTINDNNVTHNGTLNHWSLVFAKPVPLSGLGEPVADQEPVSFRIFSEAPGTPVSQTAWTAIGPAAINTTLNALPGNPVDTHSGRIGAIAVDPSDPSGNTVYIGGASGGVWRTNNFLTTDARGPTYVPLTDLGPTFSLNIGSIAIFGRNNDPNQSIVVAATGDGETGAEGFGFTRSSGVGFIMSQDGGKSWTLLDSTDNTLALAKRDHVFVGSFAFKLVIDPHLTQAGGVIMYAAMSGPAGSAGIWRTTDTGQHWTLTRAGQATDVVLQTTDVDATSGNVRLLFGAFQGDGVYLSANQGGVWTLMSGTVGDPLIHHSENDVAVPVNAGPAPTGGKGRISLAIPAPTGNRAQDLGYQGWVYALVSTPTNNLDNLYLTKDFGQNWTVVKIPTVRRSVLDSPEWRTTNDQTNSNYNIFGQNGSPQGNYDQSIAVDPLNPNVTYVGGALRPYGMIRVDATGIQDAHAVYAFNNFLSDGGRVESGTTGAVSRNTTTKPSSYGVDFEPFRQYVNLLRDPSNPFLANVTQYVDNVARFNNDGNVAAWQPMDLYVDGTTDQHRVWTMLDPLTGRSRLIWGDDQGVFTQVLNSDGSRDLGVSTGSVSAGGVPTPGNSRNGNLQIAQFYSGSVQPSQLGADIAGALFYGAAQDNSLPNSASDVLSSGNIVWKNNPLLQNPTIFVAGDGSGVATDRVGTGTGYYYVWPGAGGSTNFFQTGIDASGGGGGIGRTFGLLQQGGGGPGQPDPQWSAFGRINFAVNPVDGSEMVISSLAGRVFRTHNQGVLWFPIAEPTILDGSQADALAYGAPLPNDPTGQLDDFIYAGTQGGSISGQPAQGHIFVTTDGGGHWTNISAGLDGSSVAAIVTNPTRGSHEVYVATAGGVFYMADSSAANPTWLNITGNLFKLTHNSFNDPALPETLLRYATTMVADWRFSIPDNPALPSGPVHPVLYVGGEGGVFRSTDKGKTWALYPSIATEGASRDGGYLPDAHVTQLELGTGNINPTTGRPDAGTSLDVLYASTFGRGSFAIRLPRPQPATTAPTDVTLAAVDVPGGNVVFSVSPDQALWRHDDKTGWTKVGGTGTIESVVAATDGTGKAVAFVISTDKALYVFDGNFRQIGGSGTIQSISAGSDRGGNPVVFAISATKSLFEFDTAPAPNGAWSKLGDNILAISGTKNNLVIAVTADNSVFGHNDQSGWFRLTSAGFGLQVSAVTDTHGQVVVDAVTVDHALFEHRDATGWIKWGGSGTIQSISAGRDAAGNANVFAVTATNALAELDLPVGWRPIAPPAAGRTVLRISAVSADRVFAVTDDQSVFGEDSKFGWFRLSGPGFAHG